MRKKHFRKLVYVIAALIYVAYLTCSDPYNGYRHSLQQKDSINTGLANSNISSPTSYSKDYLESVNPAFNSLISSLQIKSINGGIFSNSISDNEVSKESDYISYNNDEMYSTNGNASTDGGVNSGIPNVPLLNSKEMRKDKEKPETKNSFARTSPFSRPSNYQNDLPASPNNPNLEGVPLDGKWIYLLVLIAVITGFWRLNKNNQARLNIRI